MDNDNFTNLKKCLEYYQVEYDKLALEHSLQDSLHRALQQVAKSQRELIYLKTRPSKREEVTEREKALVMGQLVRENHRRIGELMAGRERKARVDGEVEERVRGVERDGERELKGILAQLDRRKDAIKDRHSEYKQRKTVGISYMKEEINQSQAYSVMNSSMSSLKSVKSMASMKLPTSNSKGEKETEKPKQFKVSIRRKSGEKDGKGEEKAKKQDEFERIKLFKFSSRIKDNKPVDQK
jgi:hypothetical protein